MTTELTAREAPARYMLDVQPAIRKGYKQTEVGVIPEDWNVKTINQISTVGRGRVISHKEISRSSNPIYPVYSSQTSNDGVMGYLGTFEFEGEYITWTTDGANAGTVFCRNGRFNCTNVCGTIKLKSENHEFVARVLGEFAPAHVSKHLGNPKLMNDVVKQIKIPLPPTKAEQEAIGEALSDADALIASLEQLITKKRHLKQGAMQELLTGKKRLPGGEWEVRRLGELANFFKGRGLPKSALVPFDGEPCIHYGELFTQYPETIREIFSRTNETKDTFRSVANDVLMPTSDVTPRGLAKASCVTIDGVILGGDILVIRSDRNRVFGPFLSYVIRYQEEHVLQLVTGSTVFHLYGSDMKKFTLPLPDIEEQIAIATILSDMDTELAALEAQLAKVHGIKQGMMQELLTGRIRLV